MDQVMRSFRRFVCPLGFTPDGGPDANPGELVCKNGTWELAWGGCQPPCAHGFLSFVRTRGSAAFARCEIRAAGGSGLVEFTCVPESQSTQDLQKWA